jgi:hypothetical protein
LIVRADGTALQHFPTAQQRALPRSSSQRLPTLTADDLDPIRSVFQWHPSEASGLLLAAADGHRGCVQVRDAGDQIALTDDTASLHILHLDEIQPHSPAAQLIDTASLTDAEAITERITGISELRYETQKAARRNGSPVHTVTVGDLDQVDHHANQGADYISMRRLSELVGASTLEGFAALGQLLAQHRSDRYASSIYDVHCR